MTVGLRGAVVGLGRMGITHLATLNTHPGVVMVAGCDSTEFILNSFERYSQLAVYKNLAEMLDKAGPDFLVVATPTASHFEFIKMALERGIHVFTEKPFVLVPSDGCVLVDLAREKTLVNQVGYFLRSETVFQEVRRIVQQGLIGRVLHYTNESFGRTVVRPPRSGWRARQDMGGGCMLDFASHCIDLSHFLFGPVESVRGSKLRKVHSTQVEDMAFSTLRHRDGVGGTVLANWSDTSYRRPFNRIEIHGERGRIVADRQEYRLYLAGAPTDPAFRAGWSVRYLADMEQPVRFNIRGNAFVSQLDAFVDCIARGARETPCSFADALETDRVIELIRADAGREE